MAKIFISYRTDDEGVASAHIAETLARHFGQENIFRDSSAIQVGEDFRPRLWRALGDSAIMIVVIGPRWLTMSRAGARLLDQPDDYVRREIAFALQLGTKVVPVLVGNVALPRAEDLPEDIRDLVFKQYTRLRPRESGYDMAQLIDKLEKTLGRGAQAPEPEPEPSTMPLAASTPQPQTNIGFQFNDEVDARGSTLVAGDLIGQVVPGSQP